MNAFETGHTRKFPLLSNRCLSFQKIRLELQWLLNSVLLYEVLYVFALLLIATNKLTSNIVCFDLAHIDYCRKIRAELGLLFQSFKCFLKKSLFCRIRNIFKLISMNLWLWSL